MTSRSLAALVVFAAAAGCGGGDDPITVTFDPPEVAVAAQAGRTGEQTVTASATLSRPLPSGAVVNVLVPADLDPASLQVRAGAQPTQFTLTLRVLSGLPVGTHRGTIALALDSDSPSANRHSRVEGALRYAVAVVEPSLVGSTITIEPPYPAIGSGYDLGGVNIRLERGGETITKQYDVAAP